MSTSRRSILAAGLVALSAVGAGCATLAANGCGETPTTDRPVEVRLVGPDAERTLFHRSGVEAISEVRDRDRSSGFTATLTNETATSVRETFRSASVVRSPDSFEVRVVERDRVVTNFGITRSFAETVASGDWDNRFRLTFGDRSTAERVHEMFRCG